MGAEGTDGSLHTEDRSLWDLIEARAAATPDAVALLAEDGPVSFGALRDRAVVAARRLATLGVEPGTTVSWQLPTRAATVVLSAALSRLGAVQTPVLHLARARELAVTFSRHRPDLHLCPGTWQGVDFVALAADAGRDGPAPPRTVAVDADLSGLPEPAATLPPAPVDLDQVRWVYQTSGTTSEPKGVRHSDRSLIAGGVGLARALALSPADVGSIAFPFAHIAGPDYLVMLLTVGFPAVLLERFVPDQAVGTLRHHRATVAGGSTAFYQAFLAEQRKQPGVPILPSLRLLSGGGAPLPPSLFWEVAAEMGVRIVHGYGMTEVPMIAMGRPSDTDEQLASTVGRPVERCEVRIVTSDGTEARPGEDGEVCVRGPMVCLGYTDDALTADAFDAAGFFHTGDIGHLRPDDHLVLTGRLKDIIIRKGENISAKEIEDLLHQLPQVGDVAVIGLPDPDRGERVCAVVETAAGYPPLGFEDMVAHLRAAGLMTQKIPEQLEVVDRLPRSDTLQKVRKDELRRRYG
jgi:cyclohexanecarboxylate-CoA ligase